MQMDSYEEDQHWWQHNCVQYVKASYSHYTCARATLEHPDEEISDHWNGTHDAVTHLSRPIAFLIPGEQVSSDDECRYYKQDNQPGDPN
jgi:hypothetical protein